MRFMALVSVVRLLPQEKHYCGYWKNGGHRNTLGKVLALAVGTPVIELLIVTNKWQINFSHKTKRD